jgi:hypothetical protein
MTKQHGKSSEFATKGNLVRRQREIWDFFFKTHL